MPTLVLLLLACSTAALSATTVAPRSDGPPVPNTVHSGRAGETSVKPPRLDGVIKVNGVLDEPEWASAALLTGFSQFAPRDGVAAADSTHVLVWYSATAIHFGIRAFEAHGAVHATLADRDKIETDDHVEILLGTFHDHRQALSLAVNPLGVQADGTIFENSQALNGGWNGVVLSRVPADLSQDFVYASAGRITDYGYEVEVRIPFRSLKFQSAESQTWDLNVVRYVQHSGFQDTWAAARRDKPSFLEQSGSLVELTHLDRGVVLDVTPVVTERVTGAFAESGTPGWRYSTQRPQLGANVRWGLTNDLTLNGTIRPDFAEVESDAAQIVMDPRLALFFPEKRPFFLDGMDQFNVPNNLIYTRRIAQPSGALKLVGKVAGTGVALLSAVDDPSLSASKHDAPRYNIARVLRDFGRQSRIGMAYTDRSAGSSVNRVADLDSRLSLGGPYSAVLQVAGSHTRAAGVNSDGLLWQSVLNRSGKAFTGRFLFAGTSTGFRSQTGFISRTGLAHAMADNNRTWYGGSGALIERATAGVLLDEIWQYENFRHGGDAQDKKMHINTSASIRGGWNASASLLVESFGFDNALYRNYRIARSQGTRVDTLPFIGTPRIPNRDYVVTLTTPKFQVFSGTVVYLWGRDENFFEWASSDIKYVSAKLNARPTEKLRIDGTMDYQDFRRRTDGSTVGRTVIPRLKTEYQIGRSLFVRVVGQYTKTEHNDLRDDGRTGYPLIINGSTAIASKAGALQGDFLISYRPDPGTVLFVGYGSQGESDPDARDRFTFQPLRRQRDYFFMKWSATLRR